MGGNEFVWGVDRDPRSKASYKRKTCGGSASSRDVACFYALVNALRGGSGVGGLCPPKNKKHADLIRVSTQVTETVAEGFEPVHGAIDIEKPLSIG
jgi:hypothetical protein